MIRVFTFVGLLLAITISLMLAQMHGALAKVGTGGAPTRLTAAGLPDMTGVTQEQIDAYPGRDPVYAPGLSGFAPIPTNYDRSTQILQSQTPASPTGPNDPIGAFRFICQPGQVNWDDPIVYPGQPNAGMHLHQWFGNTLANGLSTYRSLRTSGESTCMGPLNRSAYWIPAMLNDQGQVVRPDYVSIYYKRLPASSPDCYTRAKACLPLPNGLRYIFGYDMKRVGEKQPENLIFNWKCVTADNRLRGGLVKRFDELDCPGGNILIVTMASPDCWDGNGLDSDNHRDHIIHQIRNPWDGKTDCPSQHPYMLPQFTIGVAYRIAEGEQIKNWHLSSDQMPGMPELSPGGSFHADWYGAWDDKTLQTWTNYCINQKLSCVDGQLGDGTTMRRPAGFGYVANPRLVPIPVHTPPS